VLEFFRCRVLAAGKVVVEQRQISATRSQIASTDSLKGETSRPLAPHHSRQSRHDPSAKRPAERHEESPHKPNQ